MLSFSGLLLCACAASWRSRKLRGGRFCSGTPLHRLRHRQGFIGDHRLQRGARALLGGGGGCGISFSKRSQHLESQLLQAPVTLGRFTTTLRIPCLTALNSRPLDPQTSAARPRTSSDVQFSLKIRILHLGGFRWTNPNGGQNRGQTHSQTKRIGPLQRIERAFDHSWQQ